MNNLKNRGSLMLEFLISLAIFTFAFAGLAVLQNTTTRSLNDTESAFVSAFLVDDVFDRIEAALPLYKEYTAKDLGKDDSAPVKNSALVSSDLKHINDNARSFGVLVTITPTSEYKVNVKITNLVKEEIANVTREFRDQRVKEEENE